MNRSNILLAFMAAGALAAGGAFAKRSGNPEPSASSSLGSGGQQNLVQRHNVECSHYMAMNAAGQRATVNSMRSRMPAANKMPSSHETARKVAASCRNHPEMMVHEVLEKVMPRTSVMPH
jgi:hypothetical protein